MKPTEKQIASNLKGLRTHLIEGSQDPVEQRIAQAMEHAVRWVTEDTVGWPGLPAEARTLAGILRRELDQP